jgi:hypothetical protein
MEKADGNITRIAFIKEERLARAMVWLANDEKKRRHRRRQRIRE